AVVDTAPAPRDRAVLVVHNCACAERIVAAQIAREGRDGRHDNDHFELPALSRSPQDTVRNGSPDQVLDRALTLVRGGDEELVFDVYEVLRPRDDLYVCIGNRMLSSSDDATTHEELTS